MGSKSFLLMCLILAIALVIPSQVIAARGLTNISTNTKGKATTPKETKGVVENKQLPDFSGGMPGGDFGGFPGGLPNPQYPYPNPQFSNPDQNPNGWYPGSNPFCPIGPYHC